MRSLRDSFRHLEQCGDFAEGFFSRYEAEIQDQTTKILALEEGLHRKLDDKGRELLKEMSEVYGDAEAISADFLVAIGLGFARQLVKAIVLEEGDAAKAAKADEIYALFYKFTHEQDARD